jgi:hypothetical protein
VDHVIDLPAGVNEVSCFLASASQSIRYRLAVIATDEERLVVGGWRYVPGAQEPTYIADAVR